MYYINEKNHAMRNVRKTIGIRKSFL